MVGDDGLELQVPAKDGFLRPSTFRRADVGAYNSAVKEMREKVQAQRLAQEEQERREQEAAEREALEDARVQAETDLTNARSELEIDLAALEDAARLGNAVGKAESAAREVQQAYDAGERVAERDCTDSTAIEDARNEAAEAFNEASAKFARAAGSAYTLIQEVSAAAITARRSLTTFTEALDVLAESGGQPDAGDQDLAEQAGTLVQSSSEDAEDAQLTLDRLNEKVNELSAEARFFTC